MTVAVTGASGHLGSSLICALLARGRRVGAHHLRYRERFADHAPERRTLLPWVW